MSNETEHGRQLVHELDPRSVEQVIGAIRRICSLLPANMREEFAAGLWNSTVEWFDERGAVQIRSAPLDSDRTT